MDIVSIFYGIEFYEYEENSVWFIIMIDVVLKILFSEFEVFFIIIL